MPRSLGTEWCVNHRPDSEEVKANLGIGGSQPGSGRPRAPRANDLQRQIVEAAAMEIMEPYLRVLGLEAEFDDEGKVLVRRVAGGGAKLYGSSKDGYIKVSKHDDLGAMVKVAEAMMDRVYGRPRQSHEIGGPGGGPVEVKPVQTRERAADVARILANAGALPHEGRTRRQPPQPSREPTNGKGHT